MPDRIDQVLFLCTGNSARSILAEVLLNRMGAGRFAAQSAGSQPSGTVHPMALQVLREHGEAVSGLRSKSFDEFAGTGAPAFDFVFTVCDHAAGEACPVWIGQPVTAHWGLSDPAAFKGPKEEERILFDRTYRELQHRIDLFTKLALRKLDRTTLVTRLNEIGQSPSRDD